MHDLAAVVVNWVWQGSLVTLLAAATLRRARPRSRAAVTWAAWLTVLALPFLAAIAGARGPESNAPAPLVALPDAEWWMVGALASALGSAWLAVQTGRLARAAIARRRAVRASLPSPPPSRSA